MLESFINQLVSISLFFSHDPAYIAGMLFCYTFPTRQKCFRVMLLLFSHMMLNTILKWYFQVPLPEGVNPNTYAFPSGHMHASLVFYGGLLMSYWHTKMLRLLIPLLLVSIGYSLIHMGYHHWLDIYGAWIVGLTGLYLYQRILLNASLRHTMKVYTCVLLPTLGFRIAHPEYPSLYLKIWTAMATIVTIYWIYQYVIARSNRHQQPTLSQ